MSTNRTDALQISRRYATAVFSLATEAGNASVVVAEIGLLAAAIQDSAPLREALANPMISHTQKADVLAALLKTANPLTQRAVAVVARAGRAGLIPVLAEQLHGLLTAHQGEVEAVITSARPLNAQTQQQLVASLATATGKTVQLKLVEDPAVLGGLSIQLGSLRLDATLAGALHSMREQLLAPTY